MAQILGMLLLGFAFAGRWQGALRYREALVLSGPNGHVTVKNERYGQATMALAIAGFGVLMILADVCLVVFDVNVTVASVAGFVAVANLAAALGLGLLLLISIGSHYASQ